MTVRSQPWQAELRAHWAVLNNRRTGDGVATSAVGLAVADDAEILVGVDARGDHHLLVPTDPGTLVAEDSQAAHIRIQRCTLLVGGQGHTFIDIVCHRPDLSELFDDILAAMLVELASATDQPPDVVCKRVLGEWRELLSRRGGLLGDEALRGLFGELIVLERILAANPDNDLTAWCGPDRQPHDFRLENGDLEVKTLGATGATVHIHGIEQLQPPACGALHLIVVRLLNAADGVTLPELVERLQTKIDDRRAFTATLARAGYSQIDADHYLDRRFIVGKTTALPVDANFPRIVPSSLTGALPVEISAFAYSLDLSLLLPLATLTDSAIEPLFAKGTLP